MKYLIGIFTGFVLAGCAKYSQKELVQIENNVKILNKELTGKKVYVCDENETSIVKEISYKKVDKQSDNRDIYYSVVYNINNEKDKDFTIDEYELFDLNVVKNDILYRSLRGGYKLCSKEFVKNYKRFWDEIKKHFIGKEIYSKLDTITITNISGLESVNSYYNEKKGIFLEGYNNDKTDEVYRFLFMELGTDIPEDLFKNFDYNGVIKLIDYRLSPVEGHDIASPHKERYYVKICSKEEMEQKKKSIDDCKQAAEKVINYKDEYKIKLDNLKKSMNFDSLYDISSVKVVDFANNGVFVEKENCHTSYYYGIFDQNCNSTRYFIYTKDTNYANGDYFRDGGVYYKRTGVYKYTTMMGGTNSVPVLSPTKYKISDIQKLNEQHSNAQKYKTYLKDKNITECIYYEDDGWDGRKIWDSDLVEHKSNYYLYAVCYENDCMYVENKNKNIEG